MVQKRIVELDTAPELRDDDIFVALDSQLNGTNRASLGLLKQYVLDAVKERETAQLKQGIGIEYLITRNQVDFLTIGRKQYVLCWQDRTGDLARLSKAQYPEYYEFVKNAVEVGFLSLGSGLIRKLPSWMIGGTAGNEYAVVQGFNGEYIKFSGLKQGTYGYVNGGLPQKVESQPSNPSIPAQDGYAYNSQGNPWILAGENNLVKDDYFYPENPNTPILEAFVWSDAPNGGPFTKDVIWHTGKNPSKTKINYLGSFETKAHQGLSATNQQLEIAKSTTGGFEVNAIEMSMYVLVKILD